MVGNGGRTGIAAGAIAALVGIVAGCGGPEAASWCPEPADAPAVANRGEGEWSGRTTSFERLWSAAGLREGEELAYPVGVAASPGGRTAIPDFALGRVVVVGPDGEWSGSWTRQGEGPGEVRRPVAAAWASDARLAIFDIAGPRVVYAVEGEPGPDAVDVDPAFTAPIVAGGALTWAGVRPDGTVLLVPPPARPEGAGPEARPVQALLALRPGAESPDTLARVAVPSLEPERHAPVPGWPTVLAAVAGERLAVAATDGTYRIDIYGPGDSLVLRVCRDAEGFPLRPEETGGNPGPGEHFLQGRIRAAPRPPAPAPIGRLVLGARGRLWVQRDRPDPLGPEEAFYGRPGARYDVFEPDGRYLGEVVAPERSRIQAAAGDTVWALEFGDYDEVSLVAYRLDIE